MTDENKPTVNLEGACESGASLACEGFGFLRLLPESMLPGAERQCLLQCVECYDASASAYVRKLHRYGVPPHDRTERAKNYPPATETAAGAAWPVSPPADAPPFAVGDMVFNGTTEVHYRVASIYQFSDGWRFRPSGRSGFWPVCGYHKISGSDAR